MEYQKLEVIHLLKNSLTWKVWLNAKWMIGCIIQCAGQQNGCGSELKIY